MKVIADISVVPMGVGVSVSKYVAASPSALSYHRRRARRCL